jgi:hypothetical protein
MIPFCSSINERGTRENRLARGSRSLRVKELAWFLGAAAPKRGVGCPPFPINTLKEEELCYNEITRLSKSIPDKKEIYKK